MKGATDRLAELEANAADSGTDFEKGKAAGARAIVDVLDRPCRWTPEGDSFGSLDFYRTECDEAFAFFEGGPDANRFRFCPYCGRPVAEVDPPPADDVG